jgi:hyperosmotically inducible periplasmic protein
MRRVRTLLSLSGGIAIGVVGRHFFDPDRGRARRAMAADQLSAGIRRTERALRRRMRYLGGRLEGVSHEVAAHVRPSETEPDEAVLVQKVRSEVLGRPRFAKLDVTVDTHGRTVVLRGVASELEAEQLVTAVRCVRGVEAVDNLLHASDQPAPNKLDALRVTPPIRTT